MKPYRIISSYTTKFIYCNYFTIGFGWLWNEFWMNLVQVYCTLSNNSCFLFFVHHTPDVFGCGGRFSCLHHCYPFFNNTPLIAGNGKESDLELDLSDIPMDKLDAAECLFRSVSSVIGPSVRGKINSSANFYALGGNSLNSVFLVTQLRDQGFNISKHISISLDFGISYRCY
jgi:hypothetical protein